MRYRNIVSMILKNTELTNATLTPEIKLHLITKQCHLWWCRQEENPFTDPYWAFYWPGGQALTRYILNNGHKFRGLNILDVGSGCGAAAIACQLVGARSVLANDIDHVAIKAIHMNATENGVCIDTSSDDLIGAQCSQWDVLLLGDMFYDTSLTDKIFDWLKSEMFAKQKPVYIGEPGRLTFTKHPIKNHFRDVYTTEIPDLCKEENNGLTQARVWTNIKYK